MGARGRKLPFQEFMILERGEGPVESVELRGLERAPPSDAVLEAIAAAEAIVIGPSNPVISIGPILALPGMREALRAAPAPVVAVSPFVGGRSVKGPTEAFCEQAGIEASAAGVAGAYAEVLDGIVADEPLEDLPSLVTDTLMDTAESRAPAGARGARVRALPERLRACTLPSTSRTIAILPVKSFGAAKQRLADVLGDGARKALAQAMFSDVLATLRHVPELDEIAVVTADRAAESAATGDRVTRAPRQRSGRPVRRRR